MCVYIGYNIKFHASVSRPQAMKCDVGSKSVYGTPSGFGIGLVFPERTTELFSVSFYVYLGLPSTYTQASRP